MENKDNEVFFLDNTEYVFSGKFEMLYETEHKKLIVTESFSIYNIIDLVMPMFLN
jgi:hypothetical protein